MTAAAAPGPLLMHATCVAIEGEGLLLRGPSGAGKSDLALRLIDGGGRLVADDQVELSRRDNRLYGRAPQKLAGKMEVRGIGIVPVESTSDAPITLIADLAAVEDIERLPDASCETILGVPIVRIKLAPFETSAPVKVRLALAEAAREGQKGAAQRSRSATRQSVLLVTGMSGAGKSVALKALEDLGYEAVDNLPLTMLAALVQSGAAQVRPLAIGIDIRTRDFGDTAFIDTVAALKALPAVELRLLFLDADDAVLQRRFSQTRRRHPLAHDRPMADGIRIERHRLGPLRELANAIVDTSDLGEHDLRAALRQPFGPATTPGMTILVISFAYGRGVPREADLVFDVRFLRNPHYVESLRALTGEDAKVGAYVESDPDYKAFFERLTGFLAPLLPRFQSEGKSYLTVAFGCTGGRHRSVHLAERLAAWLAAHGHQAQIRHRELVQVSDVRDQMSDSPQRR